MIYTVICPISDMSQTPVKTNKGFFLNNFLLNVRGAESVAYNAKMYLFKECLSLDVDNLASVVF